MSRSKPITENPSSLAFHIARSVAYDEITAIAHVVVLRLGDKVMTCQCPPDEDSIVAVWSPASGTVESVVNDTDSVSRMWDRVA